MMAPKSHDEAKDTEAEDSTPGEDEPVNSEPRPRATESAPARSPQSRPNWVPQFRFVSKTRFPIVSGVAAGNLGENVRYTRSWSRPGRVRESVSLAHRSGSKSLGPKGSRPWTRRTLQRRFVRRPGAGEASERCCPTWGDLRRGEFDECHRRDRRL